jgi:hypothetical protein
MAFRACSGCPDASWCATRRFAGDQVDCAEVKAAAPPKETSAALVSEVPPTLAEAAGITIRHWEMFRDRGFDAAINLLRRVLAREQKSSDPPPAG